MTMQQCTVKQSVKIRGIGVHSGKEFLLEICPALPDSGIVFMRIDLQGDNLIMADYNNVSDTQMCTVLSNGKGASVGTVEHLMSALWGCGIDNVIVKIDGDEIPVMDGSSKAFVDAILEIGVVEQEVGRKILEIIKPIRVEVEDKFIEVLPHEGFAVSCDIDFSHEAIGRQSYSYSDNESDYYAEVSKARTFGFVSDLDKLKAVGLARGASLDNAIGIGEGGILNEGGLRYTNEFARHKVLDCIGDLYLARKRIKGKINSFKGGHLLNNLLLKKIFSMHDCYRIIKV